MRASRAYIAGLGTTSVLVGSTLLLFLVVTALVAFRAWPGAGITDAVGDLVVRDSQPALTVDGPAQVALDAAAAAAAVGAAGPAGGGGVAAAAPRSGSAPGGRRVTDGGGAPGSGTPIGQGTQPPGAGAPSRSPGVLGPDTPQADPASGLGDATQPPTGGLGQTVGGVNPDLALPVTDTGEALAELVGGPGQ